MKLIHWEMTAKNQLSPERNQRLFISRNIISGFSLSQRAEIFWELGIFSQKQITWKKEGEKNRKK